MTELGYSNAWTNTPGIVKKCWENGHKREEIKGMGNERKIICRECDYSYKIDSSD